MDFTYYGHSCFSVVLGGKKILFDPFITGNELAASINIGSIEADYIFVSHGHADHTLDCITLAQSTGAQVVCSWEIHEWLNKKGVPNTHPMNTGGKWHFDFGTVKCVVAQHSSGLPDGSYGGNPMGFIFITDEINFYYSGDTALTLDMQLIPMFAEIDLAILPIGDNFTMGIEDASEATKMIQTKKVIGVHFDTFGFIKIDHQKAIELFRSKGLELILPEIGETINTP
ncbi:metal-dependent hydrolase [Ferruginibacter lapsinanis]|uniref:metal-dependent hydrolase n=1 Tax=Ferruginibacter lapsinanis TaxID=563172 RepID=UPI001E306EEA|nr:metal-dependent hydrolase [Ferruginibacter lapsinanis]UEG48643.1 metal-dependent hydrolase [Ferruginibacter lapsinanis]